MEDNRKPSKGEQRRIDACETVVNWASEDRKHRGCIVLATDEKSSTCAVLGQSQNLITALASTIKNASNLRSILSAALMLDMIADGSKSGTDKDK